MAPGGYAVSFVETHNGQILGALVVTSDGLEPFRLNLPPFRYDLAVAVRPESSRRGPHG